MALGFAPHLLLNALAGGFIWRMVTRYYASGQLKDKAGRLELSAEIAQLEA